MLHHMTDGTCLMIKCHRDMRYVKTYPTSQEASDAEVLLQRQIEELKAVHRQEVQTLIQGFTSWQIQEVTPR